MIFPALRYRDAVKAIDWLVEAFGFEKHAVHLTEEGTVAHAELRYGKGLIMINSADTLPKVPDDFKQTFCSIYIAVSDVDAHHARAEAAGAEVTPLVDQDYGSREYSARDLEGNHWHFGSYVPEIW